MSAPRRKALQRFSFDLGGSVARARLLSAGQTPLEGKLTKILENSGDMVYRDRLEL